MTFQATIWPNNHLWRKFERNKNTTKFSSVMSFLEKPNQWLHLPKYHDEMDDMT